MNTVDLVNEKINNLNRKEIENYVTNYYGVLRKESKISFFVEEKNAIIFSCINEGIEQFFSVERIRQLLTFWDRLIDRM